MKEEFLHYIWKFRLLQNPLFSTKNESIEVLNPGLLNSNAGPDFLQAKVKIGNTLWAGNIELHIQASDWNAHHHQIDKAYNSTILHVVYDADADIKMENGEEIPCLEIKGKFRQELLEKYEGFLKSKKWIPCSGQINEYPEMYLNALYSRMSIERLEDKTRLILNRLEKNKNDWEETFYQVLAGTFGLKINQEVFLQLAESLSLKKVLREQNNLFQIEALLFGQSGLLQMKTLQDEYPIKLKNEYTYLANKYKLHNLPGHLWKYLRLRPSNFPTIRISQFAAVLFANQNLFSKMIEADQLETLIKIFKVDASPYWNTHYIWDKPTRFAVKTMSDERINLMLINAVIPFLFLYGKLRNKHDLVEKAFNFFELIPAEKNNVSRGFTQEGLKLNSAFQTQALLHLKSAYCDEKRCLSCPIGSSLLR